MRINLRSIKNPLRFTVVLSILGCQSCGDSRPADVPEGGWWDQFTELPSIPTEDTLKLEDFPIQDLKPVSSELYRRLYGESPTGADTVWAVAERRAGKGLGVLVRTHEMVDDRIFECLEYIELNRTGEASGPVLIAAQDNTHQFWKVSALFRSRYGLQQVTESSSSWVAEHGGEPDTLFTQVLSLNPYPGRLNPDTGRVEQVWRILRTNH